MTGRNDDTINDMLSGVKPLAQNRVEPYRTPTPPIPKQRILDDQRVMDELLEAGDDTTSFESGDELKFLRDGYTPRLLKRLRRGDFAIQDELDLHGFTTEQAKYQTHGFINECAKDKIRAIRIIHGKGHHSAGRLPVIKNHLLGWLKKNQYVIAVSSSPAHDGGTGSVYVLLG